MRTVTAIVLAYCLATSSATFKFLRSRTRSGHEIQPIEGYRALNYLRTPVPVPLPVSTFRKHVETYRVSPPSLPAPIPTYVVPQTYSVPVYPQTLAVGYSVPSVIGYGEPYAGYFEPPPAQVVEEQYSACEENSGPFGWK